jgi:ABC-type nitrate/sulfonate/bicarbonate transport system permease component
MRPPPRLPGCAPWRPPWTPGPTHQRHRRARRCGNRALPFIGPIVLFIIWDLAVRTGFIKAHSAAAALDALGTLVSGLAGGPLLKDFGVTVWRTLQAFLIAAVVGMPLGVLLGSNEGLPQRGVPDRLSSAPHRRRR